MLPPQVAPQNLVVGLVAQLLNRFESAGINYVVLGRNSKIEIEPGAEIDIAVAAGQLKKARNELKAFANYHKGEIVQDIWHDIDGHCYVANVQAGDSAALLIIDICSDVFMGGRLISKVDELLNGRSTITISNISVYVPSAAQAFSYYLQKRIMKNDVPPEAQRYLNIVFAEDISGCRALLIQKWGAEKAAILEAAVRKLDWRNVNLQTFRSELIGKGPSVHYRMSELARYLWRILHPNGLVVAILGPDGSGKSTLAPLLSAQLKPMFPRAYFYHLFPPVRTGCESAIVTNPHGKPVRGPFFSAVKLIYMILRYNCGWARSVWLQRRRTGIIYFDRYYDDILADPLRYRNGSPAWIVRIIGSMIPRPDIFLILNVAPEIARGRKAEVSIPEGMRQFQAYRNLARDLDRAYLIDASQAPERVATDCAHLCIEFMAQRMLSRT